MSNFQLNRFSSSKALAKALAAGTGAALSHGIADNRQAILVVSGGRTPLAFFEALSNIDINWQAVTIMLADERWVPEGDERSNARLVRKNLLQNKAEKARFAGFYTEGASAEDGARLAGKSLKARTHPFDAVILGLGTDGHTASLFPDAPEIASALSPNAPPVLAMHPASQSEPRITLSARLLRDTRFLALHIEGVEKHLALEEATREGPAWEMPIRAIMRTSTIPMQVYWCP
ncbi:MAG: 6-phosphogluconolactonase [Hyphomicrobiales bacterium]